MEKSGRKRFHFVLVHGAGHGAWCWYKVTARLQQAGHKVDAIDMPGAGLSKADPNTITVAQEYSVPLVHLLQALPSNTKIVLVGHSLAGINLTYALEHLPNKVAAAIYVGAMMFPTGSQASDIFKQMISQSDFVSLASTGREVSFKQEYCKQILYTLSPPEDVVLAKSLLKPFPAVDPTVEFTKENYGTVPRYYVKTLQDQVIVPALQDEFIRLTPPTEVLELNSDHSPFFSQVDDLVRCLLEVADKYYVSSLET